MVCKSHPGGVCRPESCYYLTGLSSGNTTERGEGLINPKFLAARQFISHFKAPGLLQDRRKTIHQIFTLSNNSKIVCAKIASKMFVRVVPGKNPLGKQNSYRYRPEGIFQFFFCGLILGPPRYVCFYSEKRQIHL